MTESLYNKPEKFELDIPKEVREKLKKGSKFPKITDFYLESDPCVNPIDLTDCSNITELLNKYEGCHDPNAKTKILAKIYDLCKNTDEKIGDKLDNYFANPTTTEEEDKLYRKMQNWLENETKTNNGGKKKSRRRKHPKKKTRRHHRKSVRRR
jgi:hypothetical protein